MGPPFSSAPFELRRPANYERPSAQSVYLAEKNSFRPFSKAESIPESTVGLRESLTLFREMGNRPGIMRCLDGLADVARRRELPERAARIFGAAENLRESVGAAPPLAERLELDQNVSALRAHLGDAAFASAWTAGRAMTLEQAIEYALREASNSSG